MKSETNDFNDSQVVQPRLQHILVAEDYLEEFLESTNLQQRVPEVQTAQKRPRANSDVVTEDSSSSKPPYRCLRVGHKVIPIARGFEYFPFGKTGYRQSTVGECLEQAVLEIASSLGGLSHTLDEGQVGDESSEIGESVGETLTSLLRIFDDVMTTRMPYYLGRFGHHPLRGIKVTGRMAAYKWIEGSGLAYLKNCLCVQNPDTRSSGFHIMSPSMKLVMVEMENSSKVNRMRPDEWQKWKDRSRERTYARETMRCEAKVALEPHSEMLAWLGMDVYKKGKNFP